MKQFNKRLLSESKSEFKVIYHFFEKNIIVYILMYIQNYLINMYMPSTELGSYSYHQSLLILFVSIYSMEVYSSYLRFVGFRNDRSLLKINRCILTMASVLFILTVIIGLKNWFFIFFLGYMWIRERIYFFRAKMDLRIYGRIKILQYLVTTLYVCLLIYTDKLTSNLLLFGIGAIYCMISVIYNINGSAKRLTYNEDDNKHPDASVKDIMQLSFPLAINAIVVWLLSAADQMLIDKYIDTMTLAYYSVALRNVNVIRLCLSIIMEYWPRFYFENIEKNNFMKVKLIKSVVLTATVILCLLMLLCSGIIYWLMGSGKYMDTKWMFELLIIGSGFQTIASVFMTFQTYMKHTAIYVVCLGVLSTVKFLFNWKYIHTYGVEFLLYSTVACYFAYFICSLYWGWYKERKYMRSQK